MLTVFAAMAKPERGYILERQREGIEPAKIHGKNAGRKPIDIEETEYLLSPGQGNGTVK